MSGKYLDWIDVLLLFDDFEVLDIQVFDHFWPLAVETNQEFFLDELMEELAVAPFVEQHSQQFVNHLY